MFVKYTESARKDEKEVRAFPVTVHIGILMTLVTLRKKMELLVLEEKERIKETHTHTQGGEMR